MLAKRLVNKRMRQAMVQEAVLEKLEHLAESRVLLQENIAKRLAKRAGVKWLSRNADKARKEMIKANQTRTQMLRDRHVGSDMAAAREKIRKRFGRTEMVGPKPGSLPGSNVKVDRKVNVAAHNKALNDPRVARRHALQMEQRGMNGGGGGRRFRLGTKGKLALVGAGGVAVGGAAMSGGGERKRRRRDEYGYGY